MPLLGAGMPKEERKPLKFYLLYSREKFANICFRLCVTHLSLRAREKYVVLQRVIYTRTSFIKSFALTIVSKNGRLAQLVRASC